jgi:O-antigen/teichoic acid export membrane protein
MDQPLASAEPTSDASARSAPNESQRAVRGGAFAVGGQIVTQVLRLFGQIVLTRLLPSEAFGLMAIVHTSKSAIELCSDVGIAPSIVRDPRGTDPKFLDTAWTLQAVRGVGIFVATSLSAGILVSLYGEPDLYTLVPAAATAAIVSGLQSVKLATSERNLALGRPILIEIVAQLVGLAVMIPWALWSPTVWALVAGGLAGPLVSVSLNHWLLPGYNARFGWDRTAAVSLANFGRWVFFSTLLTFAVDRSDRLIFGKMISLSMLGVYHVAATIASFPMGAMDTLARKVIFPLVSRAELAQRELAQIIGNARRVHLVLSGWVLSGLIGGGPAAVALIYDQRYSEGGWMLRWLALAGWLAAPERTNSAVCLAKGQPRWLAAGNAAKLVAMLVLLPLGYWLGEFHGALVAWVLTGLFPYAVSTIAVYKLGLRTAWQDLKHTLVVALAALASGGCLEVLRARGVHAVVQCLVVFVVVTAVWFPLLRPYLRLPGGRGRVAR